MILLSKEAIVAINANHLLVYGGLLSKGSVFTNEASFDYLLELVQSKDIQNPDKQAISEVATLYLCRIIQSHVFIDGNKRTASFSALFFIRINGYQLDTSLTSRDIIDLALSVSQKRIKPEEVEEWFKKRIC